MRTFFSRRKAPDNFVSSELETKSLPAASHKFGASSFSNSPKSPSHKTHKKRRTRESQQRESHGFLSSTINLHFMIYFFVFCFRISLTYSKMREVQNIHIKNTFPITPTIAFIFRSLVLSPPAQPVSLRRRATWRQYRIYIR